MTHINVPAFTVIKIPDEMPFEDAACFIFTYGTSHSALKDRAAIKAGETLLILGAAGGVGVAAIEIAKALGDKKVIILQNHGILTTGPSVDIALWFYMSMERCCQLKALQPGSSIMPGKVNPVIPEAVAMASADVIGNDASITVAAQAGSFQLNVMLPVIAYNLLKFL